MGVYPFEREGGMSVDYSDPLLTLREWTRRYSEAMRDHDWHDARAAALEIAKCALTCMEAAKAAESALDAHLPPHLKP